jgi:hypothetical protein
VSVLCGIAALRSADSGRAVALSELMDLQAPSG